MASYTVSTLRSILLLVMISSFASAQKSKTPSPAPAPAPHSVNLEELLSLAGPFTTFLHYLQQTDVITTFQNQANNTDQGITIFVPTDAAFSSLRRPSLSNLTKQQLTSLLLSHALPRYYSLAEFKNLSERNPVATFAGGAYTLNFTDTSGLVRVNSGWADPKISSSVYSTAPVAVYEVQRVLLPVAIFGAAPPPPPPTPAPAPAATKPSDLAPSERDASASPKASPSRADSSAGRINGVAVSCSVWVFSCGVMLLL